MIEIKAPNDITSNSTQEKIFLAGSIEMGSAEKWQEKAIRLLQPYNCVILNPRRDDWVSSWVQSIDNAQFREQVEWELNALERCNHILMYFDKKTKSPITLLELGLFARSGKLSVCCPSGYWRKGNVDIVCNKYRVGLYPDIESMLSVLWTVRNHNYI